MTVLPSSRVAMLVIAIVALVIVGLMLSGVGDCC